MSVLVADCPRCGADQMSFDVSGQNYVGSDYGWAWRYEVFSTCRHCSRATIFLVRLKDASFATAFGRDNTGKLVGLKESLNTYFDVLRHIGLSDESTVSPPEHLPDEIREVFEEGATCLSVGCVNAAATMFRLCVDMATSPLLPALVEGQAAVPNKQVRRDLGLRLPWLLDQGLLPPELADLATAIKEDGNDGAHRATLKEEDAEDILDFTVALLERLITTPKRIELAAVRRVERRKPGGHAA